MRELREILERVRELGARPAPAALATIVRVEGSSYRREGARMLLEADGRTTGVLSGGCLEADLARAAAAAIAEGAPRSLLYDLRAEEEAIWGFGLGCEGRVELLVEPLDPAARARLERELEAVVERRTELRIATVFASEGATGVGLGTRVYGFVDDPDEKNGKDEKEEKDEKRFIEGKGGQEHPARLGRADSDADRRRGGWEDFASAVLAGLRPGEARVERFENLSLLAESLLPPHHLLVIGGERDVTPLLRLGRELGWETTVVVARPPRPFEAARLAAHARLVVAPPRELARSGVELSPRTAVVVATHRYLDDLAYLGELSSSLPSSSLPSSSLPSSSSEPRSSLPSLRGPIGYLAVLGPARRRERLLADLARQAHAIASGPLAGLRGPAGLALGGRSPAEVALSIVAEVQAALAGGVARPLSELAEETEEKANPPAVAPARARR